MKKVQVILVFVSILLLLGCGNSINQGELQKAGLLLEGSIEDQGWGQKGYRGLLSIEETLGVDVEYQENVDPQQDVADAVERFVNDGVNLIFGHGNQFGQPFFEIAKDYPDVHFVYFNGTYYSDNVTSLTFNSHAMGFFAGMLASEMSKSGQVGIIAAYQWQPEIEGFYEGVKYQSPNTEVQMDFIYDWSEHEVALEMYETMKEENVDVFYPAGDAFSEAIIKKASEDELFAIGFVSDQYTIDPNAVLTSTVQHVDRLYPATAEQFNKGDLSGDILTFDFKDHYITLGEFSPEVPEEIREMLNEAIDHYIETGLLPNQ